MPPKPDFVGFYRWHIADPIVFEREMQATIQQIGALMVPKGAEHLLEEWGKRYTLAGNGWVTARAGQFAAARASRSPSGSTTIARPRSSMRASRRACRASTLPPRSPISAARL